MKAFIIPSFSSGIAAITSLIFYSLFSIQFGDELLGNFIFIISLVALVQISLIPQAWVYIIGTPPGMDIRYRFSVGVMIELWGGLFAAAILLAICLLPVIPLRISIKEVVIVFMGLWIGGCSSPQGLARRLGHWKTYLCWTLLSNIIRLLFMLIYFIYIVRFIPLKQSSDNWKIFFLFYLLPEIIRFLLVYPYLLKKFYTYISLKHVLCEVKIILKNWFFDIGSAITEVADKVVVGYLLGPTLLVVYFFARKISIVSSMFLEPFFAENYRRLVSSMHINLRRNAYRTYFFGMLISFCILVIIISSFFLSAETVFLRNFLPSAIYHQSFIFICVLSIDCFIAANRWSRFLTQLTSKHLHLFAVRLASFALFLVACSYLVPLISSLAIPISFFFCWIFETLFNINLLKKIDSATIAYRIINEKGAYAGERL